jgi:xanthine dehydrogenase molybdopterin-binding subunit B
MHTHPHTHTADCWLLSVSGEAQYVNDLPTMPNEVCAAFCLTTVGQGYITNIDASGILVRYIVIKADVGNIRF